MVYIFGAYCASVVASRNPESEIVITAIPTESTDRKIVGGALSLLGKVRKTSKECLTGFVTGVKETDDLSVTSVYCRKYIVQHAMCLIQEFTEPFISQFKFKSQMQPQGKH